MSLNIKNPEAYRLATELARLRKVSTTQAVVDAVRNDLERERKRRSGLAAKLVETGRRCAAHIQEPTNSRDHADLLYDAHGLPK